MATKWGLSDELGPIAYGEEEDEVFLGRSITQHKNVSDDTARKIDEVVRSILDKAYGRTKTILTANLDKLHAMAKLLLEYETIDVPMIDAVMESRPSPPPMGWSPGGPARDDPKPFTIGGPAPQT
jgi:cell division protease FtsH